VGGKIAQLGQRLIDGAAKSMAEDFFKRFDDEMQQRYPPPAARPDTGAKPAPPPPLPRSPADAQARPAAAGMPSGPGAWGGRGRWPDLLAALKPPRRTGLSPWGAEWKTWM
jgi:hypothetical protein